MIDNTTAVAVINHIGTSHSDPLNKLTKEIWFWCIARNIWLSAAHIAGKCNIQADLESRHSVTETEWMLNNTLLSNTLRLNAQFPQYVAYRPDPGTRAVDAFTIDWSLLKFYAFRPFSIIASVLKKIKEDKATGVCILPHWPTQAWFPMVEKMAVRKSVVRPPSRSLLHLPTLPDPPSTQAPLSPGLPLIREQLTNHNMLQTATDIIVASWRFGTSRQYQTYLRRWEKYSQSKGLRKFEATVENGIEFLATLFGVGLGYSAITTARPALSSELVLPNNITFGSHPLLERFLKGVFELKPSLPRYSRIWDVAAVLQHLKTLGPASELDLKTLTTKTTMLLCLLTGQRCQTQ